MTSPAMYWYERYIEHVRRAEQAAAEGHAPTRPATSPAPNHYAAIRQAERDANPDRP